MSAYTAETLDLSRLGAPQLVVVDHDTILAERLAHLDALWKAEQTKDPTLPDLDPLTIKSSVGVILTEEYAFGDALLRQAVNDAANALRLGTATGADLQHLAATYANTLPLVIDPGDPAATPPRPRVIEGDEELRARAQLAPEAFPEFGLTPGGYVYRVRRKYGDRIKGVRAIKTGGGGIDLIILGRAGDGTPEPELLGDIQQEFDGEGDFLSTDIVTVRAARIERYAITGRLRIKPGPDPEKARLAAIARAARLTAERHAIAEDVVLDAPAGDVRGGRDGAPYCTGISLGVEVIR